MLVSNSDNAPEFSTLVVLSGSFSAHFYIGFASVMVFVIFQVIVGTVNTPIYTRNISVVFVIISQRNILCNFILNKIEIL